MGLLREHGFELASDYAEGLEGWIAEGGRLERDDESRRLRVGQRTRAPLPSLRGALGSVIRLLERTSSRVLARASVVMVILFAAAYWLLSASEAHGLLEQGERLGCDLQSLPEAFYFSAVTATTLGYGDVTPMGLSRLLAVIEAIAGLMLFGAVISKFLSQRSEALVSETHHLAFEERLGRLRTNLHLVIAEFDELTKRCEVQGVDRRGVVRRMRSAVVLLVGELRSVHALLYRPQEDPSEEALLGILAGISTALESLIQLRQSFKEDPAPDLEQPLTRLRSVAEEICGDCVPREYAGPLREWMDRVRETAQRLE